MSIKSVSKALSILKAIAETNEGMTVQETSHQLNLPYATAHRLISTLANEGFLQLLTHEKRYRIGPELMKLFGSTSQQTNVGRRIYPSLAKLNAQLGETVHLAVRYGHEIVYLDTIVALDYLAKYTPVGTRAPIHVTALGKALVAFSSDDEIDILLSEYEFTPFTNNSIRSMDEFWQEIRTIRARGYAISMEESFSDVRCIASIVVNRSGRVEAAISVSTRPHRLSSPEKIHQVAQLVCAACRSASRELGGDLGPDPSMWYRTLMDGDATLTLHL